MKSIMRSLVLIALFMATLYAVSSVDIVVGGTGQPGDVLSQKSFIDDMGNLVTIDALAERIISLSPTHTENLFDLGAGKAIIGTDVASVYPYEGAMLAKYDLAKTHAIEAIISASPDLILIEPTLSRTKPSLIAAFERAGIPVIALLPESLEDYRWYLTKLGMLTGQEEKAKAMVVKFYSEIDRYNQLDRSNSYGVFIESSEKGFRTTGPETLPSMALTLAGLEQLAEVKPWYMDLELYPKTEADFLIENNENIHTFFSLQGDGFRGGDIPSLRQQTVTGNLDTILENRAYIIKSPLLARYTMRYLVGIEEVGRLVYGDPSSHLDKIPMNAPLSRENFTTVLYELLTLPTFVIYRSDYYEVEKFHHTYGAFADVSWTDEDFNRIETVVMKSYLSPIVEAGVEKFYRDRPVTREELEAFLYIRYDFRGDALGERLAVTGTDLAQVTTVDGFVQLLEVTEQWQ